MGNRSDDGDDGRRRGLWGWQNEVWALLFGVVSFERLYRIAATAPLELTWVDGVLVLSAVAAVALTASFTWRWRRERRSRREEGPRDPVS
ncbi:MAG: hypothetical protein ACFCVF_12065 [Kineosporiaceae bacterium]